MSYLMPEELHEKLRKSQHSWGCAHMRVCLYGTNKVRYFLWDVKKGEYEIVASRKALQLMRQGASIAVAIDGGKNKACNYESKAVYLERV
jgi:lysophospholipid acyltransferase (LPLAT)-like uncharacterized protein